MIFPAKHFVVGQDKMDSAISRISHELDERLQELNLTGKMLEAQRLEQRTRFDIEMLHEMGYCPGVENYSMHLSGRSWGDKPYSLLKYFPDDFLTIIDESHVTVPQIRECIMGTAHVRRLWLNMGSDCLQPRKTGRSDLMSSSHPSIRSSMCLQHRRNMSFQGLEMS